MRHLGFAVTAVCASVLVFAPTAVLVAGPAHADCSGAGDFGAGSGCPPPGDTSGSGGSGGEAWPPTSVDWPPSQDSSSSSDSGSKSTPIVLADGQAAPARPVHPTDSASASAASTGSSTSTSTPPTPIVPVGAAATAAPSTVIVAPAG